jgi:Glycosyl hydrolase family 1
VTPAAEPVGATLVRGLALPTWATLGEANTSNLGPTPSNGFDTLWADDLVRFFEDGATSVRVSLDWARLQPRAGQLDESWAEWYDAVLVRARSLGQETWVTLHERSVPRWFDDEGGFDDDVAAARSWPRWVERAAERFGDLVDGWVPLVPTVANRRMVWRDTWGILRGGPPVMRAVTMPGDADAVLRDAEDRTARDSDAMGVVFTLGAADLAGSAARRRTAERLGEWIRHVDDAGPGVPVGVAGFVADVTDRGDHAAGVEVVRTAIEDAVDDGVPAYVAFAEPAVDGNDALGLYDADRNATASSTAWLG